MLILDGRSTVLCHPSSKEEHKPVRAHTFSGMCSLLCASRVHTAHGSIEVDGQLGTLRVHERKRRPNGILFARDTILGPPATPGGAPKSILRRSIFEEPKSERRVSFDPPRCATSRQRCQSRLDVQRGRGADTVLSGMPVLQRARRHAVRWGV